MTVSTDSRRLRVLVDGVHVGPDAKGVGLYTVNIIEQMARLDPSTEFVVAVTFDDGRSRQLDLPSVTRVRVGWKHHFAHTFKVLPRLARRFNPSVIWLPYETPTPISKTPVAISCHDIPAEIRRAQQLGGEPSPGLKARLRDWIDDRALGRTLRHASLVFCNSSYVGDRVASDFAVPAELVRLAPCAPAADYASLATAVVPDKIRERLRCPHGYVLAFFTGDRRENPSVLPAAFDSLVQRDRPENLVVAGVKPELNESMQRLFSPFPWNSRVRILPFYGHGEEKSLAELYAAASLYLDVSLHEGFGMQILEAMACGTPVVCSDRGALPEVSACAARLFDPQAPSEISQAVTEVLENEALRSDMARAGRARALDFSWERTAQTVLDGLREIVGHTGRGSRQGILRESKKR